MEPGQDDDPRHALEIQGQRLRAAKRRESDSANWLRRYVFQRVDNHIGERLEIAMRSRR